MRRLVSILLVLFVIATPAALTAATPGFSALVVFGDSYCDVGNIALATGGAIPGPAYFMGRFSNGPIWLDHVSGFLGLPLRPSLAGGTDYAFGGADVTAAVPTAEGPIPSIPQQVLLYLTANGGKADPNALYIIEGGGNDILNAPSGANPNTLGLEIATGIATSELLLRQAGAKHFVIPNLFNIGLMPAAAGNATFATAATNATNSWLTSFLAFEGLIGGVHILRVDVFSLMNAVKTDPTHFNFVNITAPCLVGTTPCPDPDHTLFWDAEHPTAFGHSFFAVVLENVLAAQ
jgi:phospholipase/lecithinase/hemolysin